MLTVKLHAAVKLQSYILSTTTETRVHLRDPELLWRLQSYILSTTTETSNIPRYPRPFNRFNRTSFQQQLKLVRGPLFSKEKRKLQSYILSTTTETFTERVVLKTNLASIVHPFNNN